MIDTKEVTRIFNKLKSENLKHGNSIKLMDNFLYYLFSASILFFTLATLFTILILINSLNTEASLISTNNIDIFIYNFVSFIIFLPLFHTINKNHNDLSNFEKTLNEEKHFKFISIKRNIQKVLTEEEYEFMVKNDNNFINHLKEIKN